MINQPQRYNFIATSTFGLEATVRREVEKLAKSYDFSDIRVLDGRVDFCGGLEAVPACNLWLRAADRLLLNMAEFEARTFTELFDGVSAADWPGWLPEDANFIVTGKSVRSTLSSVPACQKITEKAVVEKLKTRYRRDWFPKTGAVYKIQVSLLKDRATVTLDTTGPGLHKRGYREEAGGAPLKETLAAALIELSYWRRDRALLDPLCGSGTIAIEAALAARNIAPGLARRFVSEDWPAIPARLWKAARSAAYAAIDAGFTPRIFASDNDPAAIETARHNARLAGVDDCVRFEVRDIRDIALPGDYGVAITNPPYGERMGDLPQTEALYAAMGRLFNADRTWSVYVITSHEGFERLYGRAADARRKLFNGMIQTNYYQFYGAKPPKPARGET